MPQPTGTPRYTQRPLDEQAAGWMGRIATSAAQADVAMGPLVVPATYAIFALTGLVTGIYLSMLTPWPCVTPLFAFLGLVAGLIGAGRARRLSLGGAPIGIIGATLLALCVLTGVSGITGQIRLEQDQARLRQFCLSAKEQGWALNEACRKEIAEEAAPPSAGRVIAKETQIWVNRFLTLFQIVATIFLALYFLRFLRGGSWRPLAITGGTIILVVAAILILRLILR